ncbi:caffeic acid 3-O-methyltransferase-like [Populus nigra]|uniref:caffeic acid 3-O-methyltransferase-like n=1 Tax=Populus nigra TaxID=3691 RepID=UPI002B278B26|nr:caffeic acid 3-O-methyltransferase-like [Populus nigra]
MPMAASVTEEETTQNDNQNQTVEEERESFTCAMLLVNASVLPLALKTVVDLGVLGVLDVLSMADPDVGLTAAEIAERIPTRNPEAPGMLERILRLLMNEGVVYCSSELFYEAPMKYRLGRVGKYFVRDENGVSLAPLMTLAHDKVYLETWSHLKDAILEGGTPFNRAHGTHLFEYSARDARFSQVYNTAMFNHTTLVFKKILESYSGFENLKQVVDVGGGIGVALSLITFKYPFINAINFDLPHVIQHAPPFPGVKHVEGDMFKSVPKEDAIILKWILRDWDDEHCLKLLKNCYMSVPVDGKIIVVEQILPTFAEITAVSKDKSQLDMVSLTQTPGKRNGCKVTFSIWQSVLDLKVSVMYHMFITIRLWSS